jgi:TolB-like protein/Flp pilus assembly protein TadD
MSLIAELKRRNVFRVGAAYAIVGWLLLEVASVVLPALHLPDWALTLLVVFVVAGFPLALIVAWAFELTPEGIKRESAVDPDEAVTRTKGRKLDFAIIGLLAIAVVYFAVDKFVLEQAEVTAEQVPAAESVAIEKSVAVLPFVDLSPSGDYEWFSNGLSEEILNSLAHLPELMVSARTSSFRFKGQNKPIGEIAQALGVAHVVEGSVRRGGDQLRVTAQLVRASDSFHLWSETYDRAAEDVFAVQEEIAEKIAAALDVVLDEDKRDRMFRTGTRNVQAFEAYQKGRAIYDAVHAERTDESLFDANRWLEQAIAIDPDYSAAHLMHADAYSHFLMSGGEDSWAPKSRVPGLTDEEALQRLRADIQNAYQTARDPDIKLGMDYTRTVFSNDWHRLPALIEALDDLHRAGKVLNDEGAWFGFQTTLGDAESYLAQVRDRQRPSPLDVSHWAGSTFALIALGRYAEAIEEVRRGRRIAGNSPNLTYAEALAYAFSGDPDTAARIFSTGIVEDSVFAQIIRALASALSGDEEEARLRAQEIEAQFAQHDALLWVYHQLGDEKNRARLAREIDAQPLGSQQLLSFSMVGNYLVFSLDDTPNFRARLAEMGLDASHFQPMPRFTELAVE